MINIVTREVPRTARNKRIYPGGETATVSGVGSGNIDTENLVKRTGETTQTILGDVVINGNIYAQGNVVAYSAISGEPESWWDGMPIASATVLGGIKLGANLTYNPATGKVDASGGSGVSSWNDLSDKPASFPPSAHNHAYSSLSGLPTLFSGAYSDLSGKPDLTVYSLTTHVHAFSSLSSKPTTISGYGITDAMTTAHAANAITGTNITNWNTAYTANHGHSNKSYLDAVGNNTIYHAGNFNRSDTDFTGKLIKSHQNSNAYLGTLGGLEGVTIYAASQNGLYGLKIGSYQNGISWMQVGRSDGSETPYDLAIQHLGGSVGIGTASPEYKLDVNGHIRSINGSIFSKDNGNGFLELATYQGSLPGYGSNYYPTLKSNSAINFAPNNTYVGAATYYGIEVESGKQFQSYGNGFKSYNFHGMVGDYDQNNSSSKIIWTIGDNWNTLATHYGIGYQYNVGGDGFWHTYVFRDNGTANVKISGTNGNIWGAGALTMGGDITALSSTSDQRLKENIKPLDSQIENLMALKPVSYNRIDKQENENGLIAQEVEKIFPDLVYEYDKTTGYKAIRYEKLTTVLLKAMQDQQKQIEKLEKKVYFLERRGA